MNTAKFDAFVSRFTKAGVKVKVVVYQNPVGAFYIEEKTATVVKGEYANYCLARTMVTASGTEYLEKNTKMVGRLLKKA